MTKIDFTIEVEDIDFEITDSMFSMSIHQIKEKDFKKLAKNFHINESSGTEWVTILAKVTMFKGHD